jgi:hypothetical protein
MGQFVRPDELSSVVVNLKKMIVRVLTGLADFPKSYTGHGGKYLKVKDSANGVEFGRRIYVSTNAPTSGDGETGDIWLKINS